MPITVELHIDSKGFTWEFYDEKRFRLTSWSMKRDPKGGYRGTQKGSVEDALVALGNDHPELDLDYLLECFDDHDSPTADDISTALHFTEGG